LKIQLVNIEIGSISYFYSQVSYITKKFVCPSQVHY